MFWLCLWLEFESRVLSLFFFEISLRIVVGIWCGLFVLNLWVVIEIVRKMEGRGWILFFKFCSYDYGFCEC